MSVKKKQDFVRKMMHLQLEGKGTVMHTIDGRTYIDYTCIRDDIEYFGTIDELNWFDNLPLFEQKHIAYSVNTCLKSTEWAARYR